MCAWLHALSRKGVTLPSFSNGVMMICAAKPVLQKERTWFHILGSKAACGQFDSSDWSVLTHEEFPCADKMLCGCTIFYSSLADENLRHVGSILSCQFNVAPTHQACTIPKDIKLPQYHGSSSKLWMHPTHTIAQISSPHNSKVWGYIKPTQFHSASSSCGISPLSWKSALHRSTSWHFPLFWQQRLPESTLKTDVEAAPCAHRHFGTKYTIPPNTNTKFK